VCRLEGARGGGAGGEDGPSGEFTKDAAVEGEDLGAGLGCHCDW
jgi:hypothetical protein